MGSDDAILPGGQNEWDSDGDSDQLPLEDTLLDRGLEDVLDEGYSPPERPRQNHWGETALEEELGEPLDLRLSEEEPEESELPGHDSREADRTGRLLDRCEETARPVRFAGVVPGKLRLLRLFLGQSQVERLTELLLERSLAPMVLSRSFGRRVALVQNVLEASVEQRVLQRQLVRVTVGVPLALSTREDGVVTAHRLTVSPLGGPCTSNTPRLSPTGDERTDGGHRR